MVAATGVLLVTGGRPGEASQRHIRPRFREGRLACVVVQQRSRKVPWPAMAKAFVMTAFRTYVVISRPVRSLVSNRTGIDRQRRIVVQTATSGPSTSTGSGRCHRLPNGSRHPSRGNSEGETDCITNVLARRCKAQVERKRGGISHARLSTSEQVLAAQLAIGGTRREAWGNVATFEPQTPGAWHVHPTPVDVSVLQGTRLRPEATHVTHATERTSHEPQDR
jgi:hypothetical protein